jgi:hypothetical protein
MLVWATEFPLCPGATADGLLNLVKQWIVGSPHSTWRMDMFKNGQLNEIVEYKNEGQTVLVAKAAAENKSWVGLRYIWSENNERNWTTEIVGSENSGRLCVSVQLYCDLIQPGLHIPHPRKPYIVRQIIQYFGGGFDGNLPVSDNPIFLKEADVDQATKIIKGEAGNQLPVIYASANWQHRPVVDVNKLAQWTSGIAHVVVEPSRYFSFALANHVSRMNAYDGAISIYWSNSSARQTRFFLDQFQTDHDLASEVADCVRRAMANIRPSTECTWGYIQEQISKNRIQELRNTGSTALNEYMEAFDDELAAKQERIDNAEKEISRLKVELQITAAAADANEDGILGLGNEIPFYPGEIRDVVIKTLRAGMGQIQQDGRCRHLIDDLFQANTLSVDGQKIEKEIKDLTCKSDDLTKGTKRSLEKLGFSFSEEGKHIHMVYYNDPRYAFTVQKTGSDWRGMKNLSSEIIRKLFK